MAAYAEGSLQHSGWMGHGKLLLVARTLSTFWLHPCGACKLPRLLAFGKRVHAALTESSVRKQAVLNRATEAGA